MANKSVTSTNDVSERPSSRFHEKCLSLQYACESNIQATDSFNAITNLVGNRHRSYELRVERVGNWLKWMEGKNYQLNEGEIIYGY